MLSIDEVIARERQQAKKQRSRIGTWGDEHSNKKCEVYAEYHEQLAEWLEELKAIKSDGFTDDLLNMGFTKGYNKALDDFAAYIREKVLFEERWFMDCKSNNANTNIAFSSIMTFINSVAEELKKVEIQ